MMNNWIKWNGGECPVDGNVMIEYVRRDNNSSIVSACVIDWSHNGGNCDVVQYRILSEEKPTLIDQVAKAQAELNKLKEQAQKANEALVKANDELERMVKRLEQEITDKTGLGCVIGVEVVKVDSSEDKQGDAIPDGVDIDDWRTWVKGDVVECVWVIDDDWLSKSISSGNEYTTNGTDEDGVEINSDDEGDENYIWHTEAKFRFVRRP